MCNFLAVATRADLAAQFVGQPGNFNLMTKGDKNLPKTTMPIGVVTV